MAYTSTTQDIIYFTSCCEHVNTQLKCEEIKISQPTITEHLLTGIQYENDMNM